MALHKQSIIRLFEVENPNEEKRGHTSTYRKQILWFFLLPIRNVKQTHAKN